MNEGGKSHLIQAVLNFINLSSLGFIGLSSVPTYSSLVCESQVRRVVCHFSVVGRFFNVLLQNNETGPHS